MNTPIIDLEELLDEAKNEQDYRGGFNNYTTLEGLEVKACELLDDLPFY